MSSAVIQLLVLAGIAIFLILRLKDVLGTRDGFEKPPVPAPAAERKRVGFEVIDGGPDRDVLDHVKEGSNAAKALAAMKAAEPSFGVGEFLGGARGAYEMILMAFENGDVAPIRTFLSHEVYDTFLEVIDARDKQGISIDAKFIGVRELTLSKASFDKKSGEAEITVKFVGELSSVVKDKAGKIVEGDPSEGKKQKDVWTFGRVMGLDNPNWQLVATGE
jgi:predicted lipid-binding transport protein (Tim44 family)